MSFWPGPLSGSRPLLRSEVAAYSQNCASPHPLLATPTTGTSRTPRSTRPTRAGKVSSLARSPVAPKMTSASTRSVAMSVTPSSRPRSSAESFDQVVPDPQGIGDGRERRVHRADAGEEARVDDVEVVDLVGPAVDVQGGGSRVGAEPDGAGLVGGRPDRHALVHVDAVVQQVLLLHAEVAEPVLQLVAQPLEPLDVVLLVDGEVDAAVDVEGHPVVRFGQVLAA